MNILSQFMNKIPKKLPKFILGVLSCSFLCITVSIAQSQDSKSPPSPPPPSKVSLAPETYTFSIRLPSGTDCSVSVKSEWSIAEKGERASSGNSITSSEPDLSAKKFERSIRKDISSSKEIKSDGTESIFYFIHGWCAYDSPQKGINMRHFLPGHIFSNLGVYHFPELTWATPETRQADPPVKEGSPKLHLYKDDSQTLEVDAHTGYPMRYSDGQTQWSYSYKASTIPIVLPEKLQQAVDRVFDANQRKP